MKAFRALTVSERLAAMAGVAAAIASVAGFIPGVYRDPAVTIAQSHGFDIGALIGVLVLGLGLIWSARGSVRGRACGRGLADESGLCSTAGKVRQPQSAWTRA